MTGYEIGYIVSAGLLLVALILGIVAEVRVNNTFDKYKDVNSSIDMTGAELAQMLISKEGLGVRVQMCKGKLTDNYNPKNNTLNLSQENYNSRSIASQAIVAHEFGHALQHANGYKPLFARQGIILVSNVMSRLLVPMVAIGILIEICSLGRFGIGSFIIYFAVILYAVSVILNLVTLHVEYDASNRAKEVMISLGAGDESEKEAVSKLLNAAALTYFAAMLLSVAYFLRILTIFLSSRDR